MVKNTSSEKNYKTKAAEYIYSVFSTFLLAMLCILTVFMFFFRLVQVDGDSMYPTLYSGDKIITSNFLYTPDYGDIISVNKKGAREESMIKRVIALPGDVIMIDFETHIITVNGKVLFEDYSVAEPISEQGDFLYPLTVPDDSYFVLGDNRNNSVDSRKEEVGFIKSEEITGKALLRVVPFGRFSLY